MTEPPQNRKPKTFFSLTEMVVRAAYALNESSRYKRAKRAFHDLLENPDSKTRPYFDISMIVLVLTSIFFLIYEVEHGLSPFASAFERFIVSVFIVEYLLRMWVYSHNHLIVIEHYERAQLIGTPLQLGVVFRKMIARKWEYMTSPLAIIDLLAILPSYRPLRILRVFLLFRLFKLFRYTRSIHEFTHVLLERKFEFYTLGLFLGFVVFAASTAIYIFEGGRANSDIKSFFDAVYWALVTISTVGYGDIIPTSTEGRVIALVLIVSGIGVISFSTSIVVAAFTEKLKDLREHRVYSEVERYKDYIVIAGYGRVGEVVADMLKHDGDNVLVIDVNPQKVEHAKQNGFLAIQGDAGETSLLRAIDIRNRPSKVLCLTTDDVTNVYITLSARKQNRDIKIISRANKEESIKKLELAGADHVITPYEVVGLIASESIGQPVAFEAIYGMLTGHKYFTIDTIAWPKFKSEKSVYMSDIDFKQFKTILLGVITPVGGDAESAQSYTLKEHRFVFNPSRGYEIREGMLLVVFGHRYSIDHFRDRLATGKIVDGKLAL